MWYTRLIRKLGLATFVISTAGLIVQWAFFHSWSNMLALIAGIGLTSINTAFAWEASKKDKS